MYKSSNERMCTMSEKNKKIEIITDDSSNLVISPVYEHIKDVKPKITDKKNIIIPGEKKKENEDDEKEDSEN